MMDGLTRWSIALGVGAIVGLAALGGYNVASTDAKQESLNAAIDQLMPDQAVLDATFEFDTFDRAELSEIIELIVESDVEGVWTCGGYQPIGEAFHPAHVCAGGASLTAALDLYDANANVIRDDFTLTVGKYSSPYKDLLVAADTVIVDTTDGVKNATYEGNGTFTLTFMDRGPTHSHSAPWQFALAAVPAWAVFLTAGGIAGLLTVLVSGLIRQKEEEPVETVGVEYFDEVL